MKKPDRFLTVFQTIKTLTFACGAGAFVLAVLAILYPSAQGVPFVEPLFNTLLFLFAAGVGSIFTLIGTYLGVGRDGS